MKCQVKGCENEGKYDIGITIPDTATEIFRLLVPVTAKVCEGHVIPVLRMAVVTRVIPPSDPEIGGDETQGFFCDACKMWTPTARHTCLAELRA